MSKDAERIDYAAPLPKRLSPAFYVALFLLVLQIGLLGSSVLRPARTALALPLYSDPRAFNRVGVANAHWVALRVLNAPPPASQTSSPPPVLSRHWAGLRYQNIPGVLYGIHVHTAWTIVPNLMAVIWLARTGRRRST